MIVVIADDYSPGRELMREVLESDGHVVHEAADGVEAMNLVSTKNPAVVLLDLQMPIVDGFGVLDQLRHDPRYSHIPVIAVTASAMQGDRERAIEAGFDSYIAKPFSPREVRRQINTARRQNQEYTAS